MPDLEEMRDVLAKSMSPGKVREMMASLDTLRDWLAQKPDVWHWLSEAFNCGAGAAEIEHTKPTRDNPFKGRAWRWAWYTGFDIARRIAGVKSKAISHLEAIEQEVDAEMELLQQRAQSAESRLARLRELLPDTIDNIVGFLTAAQKAEVRRLLGMEGK